MNSKISPSSYCVQNTGTIQEKQIVEKHRKNNKITHVALFERDSRHILCSIIERRGYYQHLKNLLEFILNSCHYLSVIPIGMGQEGIVYEHA